MKIMHIAVNITIFAYTNELIIRHYTYPYITTFFIRFEFNENLLNAAKNYCYSRTNYKFC